MNTPIYDFVKAYRDLRPARLHMPGHKGRGPLGCEEWDITEIPGADSLYEAAGIIAESEANASRLFGCPSFYSTEGSSHCIRAMLLLAAQACHCARSEESVSSAAQRARKYGSFDSAPLRSGRQDRKQLRVLAARNCHKAFLSAAALLDLDVAWLPASTDSYLSAQPTPELLDAALTECGAAAVYLTCPDYLGFLPKLRPLAEVCHAHGALLLVDNAHGAYLRFLNPSQHPMDLGADLCCDSAHKTLPVLTGGAYLHVAERLVSVAGRRTRPLRTVEAGRETRPIRVEAVREALALFGSSSPSYLILQSLDLANPYLETLPERLAGFLPKLAALKARLTAAGWKLVGDEPMKLTLDLRPSAAPVGTSIACPLSPAKTPVGTSIACLPFSRFASGTALAAALEQAGIYCEFFDADFLVCMLAPENTEEELRRLETALQDTDTEADGSPRTSNACPCSAWEEDTAAEPPAACPVHSLRGLPEQVCSIREALLAPAEQVPAKESLGRVLARPGVSCPPAVPILMPGERIDEAAIAAFSKYGIDTVFVLA